MSSVPEPCVLARLVSRSTPQLNISNGDSAMIRSCAFGCVPQNPGVLVKQSPETIGQSATPDAEMVSGPGEPVTLQVTVAWLQQSGPLQAVLVRPVAVKPMTVVGDAVGSVRLAGIPVTLPTTMFDEGRPLTQAPANAVSVSVQPLRGAVPVASSYETVTAELPFASAVPQVLVTARAGDSHANVAESIESGAKTFGWFGIAH